MKRKAIFLGIVQVIIAVGAIPAGLFMILEPDGSRVGMSVEMLSGSPFRNFFIPGLFLLGINGILNATGAFLSFAGKKYAGISGLGLGIYLVIWICVQVYFIGLTFFLQPLFLVIGIIEIFLGYSLLSKRKSITNQHN